MKFKRFMALAMAGVMTLAMTGSAMAAEPSPASPDHPSDKVQVKKEVVVAEGVTVSGKLTFSGSAWQKEQGSYVNEDGTTMPAAAAKATATASIEYNKALGENETSLIDYADISVDGDLTPGEYTFELKETVPAQVDGYGWEKVTAPTYYLHVYVDSTNKRTYSITEDRKIKKAFADYKNKFTKKGGSDIADAPSLVISKAVANGTYADPETPYTFTVSFNVPEDTVPAMPEGGYEYDLKTGNTTTESGKKCDGSIVLKDGQSAVFTNIPAGVKVTVEETTLTNIDTVTINAIENGNTPKPSKISGEKKQKIENMLIGEKANSIAYTNTYTTVTPTGLAISVAPFVAMFAAVGAAIALYIAAKRRVR